MSGQDRDGESCLSQLQSAYHSAKRIEEMLEKLDPKENSLVPQIHLCNSKLSWATRQYSK